MPGCPFCKDGEGGKPREEGVLAGEEPAAAIAIKERARAMRKVRAKYPPVPTSQTLVT